MRPFAPRPRTLPRLATLGLLPLLLVGCGAGAGDTSAAEGTPAVAESSAEPTAVPGDAVPGMGRTAEPTADDDFLPPSEWCADVDAATVQAVYPGLPAPSHAPEAAVEDTDLCLMTMSVEHSDQVIAEQGLDPENYDLLAGQLGARWTVQKGGEQVSSEMPWDEVSSGSGRPMKANTADVYGPDYATMHAATVTDQGRLLTLAVTGFVSEVTSQEALEQAVLEALDRTASKL